MDEFSQGDLHLGYPVMAAVDGAPREPCTGWSCMGISRCPDTGLYKDAKKIHAPESGMATKYRCVQNSDNASSIWLAAAAAGVMLP